MLVDELRGMAPDWRIALMTKSDKTHSSSPVSDRLTPAEIEALRQDARDASDFARGAFGHERGNEPRRLGTYLFASVDEEDRGDDLAFEVHDLPKPADLE